jgi:transcriptional regulator with XRE-family HTH domain
MHKLQFVCHDEAMSTDQDHHAETRTARLRAKYLVQQNHELIASLVQIRKESGLAQADVAQMLGNTQQAVSEFERMLAPASLSRIANYAHAVGAIVTHHVVKDTGQLSYDANAPDDADCNTPTDREPEGRQTEPAAPSTL